MNYKTYIQGRIDHCFSEKNNINFFSKFINFKNITVNLWVDQTYFFNKTLFY